MKRATPISRSSEQAAYVLELALAFPVLLFLIVGALDVAKVVHAYSSMRSSVDDTLRCLYTSDGGCVNASGTPIYRSSYTVDISEPHLGYDVADYSGSAQWLTAPTYQYEAMEFFPQSVSYGVGGHLRTQSGTGYQNSATFSVITRNSPRIINPTLANPPPFTVKYNETLDPNRGRVIETHRGRTSKLTLANGESSSDVFLEYSFTVNKQPDATSAQIDSCAIRERGTFVIDDCTQTNSRGNKVLMPGLNDSTPYVLLIKGTASSLGETSTASGKVSLSIVDDAGNAENLEGRSFSLPIPKGGNANFVPRGEDTLWIPGYKKGEFASEYDAHNGKYLVYGKKYKIRLGITRVEGSDLNSGGIQWKPDSVELRVPDYQAENITVKCESGKNNCNPWCKPIDFDVHGGVRLKRNVVENQTRSLGCFADDNGELIAPPTVNSEVTLCNVQPATQGAACGSVTRTKACPSQGFTCTDDPKSNMNSICPVNDPKKIAGSEQYKFSEVKLTGTPWTVTSCTGNNREAPSEWNGKCLSVKPVKTEVATAVIATNGITPKAFKEDPANDLNCAEFKVEPSSPMQLDNCKKGDGSASLFSGQHVYQEGWESLLKSEALACGIAPGAYIEVAAQRSEIKVENQEDIPAGALTHIYPTEWNPLPGKYEGEELPAKCSEKGMTCRKNLGTPEKNGEYHGPVEVNLQSAVTLASNQLQAFYPSASLCEENSSAPNCAHIRGYKGEGGVVPGLTATMHVPLMLLSAVGKETVKISYSNDRKWEGEYSKIAK